MKLFSHQITVSALFHTEIPTSFPEASACQTKAKSYTLNAWIRQPGTFWGQIPVCFEINDNILKVAAKFQAPFSQHIAPTQKWMEWTLCAQIFPQVWDHGVLGIKAQLRAWLWQALKQLTACSVLHPAPRSEKASKVELWSPHFATKLDSWKEAVSFCIYAMPKAVEILSHVL